MSNIGRIVFSKAGRDKGNPYVVIGECENFMVLSDGIYKTLNAPKKKNIRHIQPTNYISGDITALINTDSLSDVHIKHVIKNYLNKIIASKP